MFLERSTAVCLDFELVQLSWDQLSSAAQWLFCKFENFTSFCLLLFAVCALFCFSLELCVYFAVYLSIRSNRSGSISLVSAERSPRLLLRHQLQLHLGLLLRSCAVPVSVCCLFNWLDCLSLMACAGHDATRRDDVGRLCQRRRRCRRSRWIWSALIGFCPPYPLIPYPRCLLVLPCQMSCCESIFGCMHRPPQLPLAIMHLKGFRTINLCRLQGINKSRYRRRRRRCRC